jgi:hypothetical protein
MYTSETYDHSHFLISFPKHKYYLTWENISIN